MNDIINNLKKYYRLLDVWADPVAAAEELIYMKKRHQDVLIGGPGDVRCSVGAIPLNCERCGDPHEIIDKSLYYTCKVCANTDLKMLNDPGYDKLAIADLKEKIDKIRKYLGAGEFENIVSFIKNDMGKVRQLLLKEYSRIVNGYKWELSPEMCLDFNYDKNHHGYCFVWGEGMPIVVMSVFHILQRSQDEMLKTFRHEIAHHIDVIVNKNHGGNYHGSAFYKILKEIEA